MKKTFKRVLSVALAVCLAFSCFAVAFAADSEPTGDTAVTTEENGFVTMIKSFFNEIKEIFKKIGDFFKGLKKPEIPESDPGTTPEQIAAYHEKLDGLGIFENKAVDALPQTITHKLVLDHFAAPLPEGKTAKKAIVIGFDGCRADALSILKDKENSGVFEAAKTGAIYQTFSGGWPGREQQTATTAGWGCILTGGFAEYSGLNDNKATKKPEVETFLTTLAKQGYTGSFDVSWKTHLKVNYKPDVDAAKRDGLPIFYKTNSNDYFTFHSVLNRVTNNGIKKLKNVGDPDVLFLTLEYTDHNGHDTKFTLDNPKYVKAVNSADDNAYSIIKRIESRKTYATEDWLIILTTDHGGVNTSHGGQSVYERSTWLAVNKPIENLADFAHYEVK